MSKKSKIIISIVFAVLVSCVIGLFVGRNILIEKSVDMLISELPAIEENTLETKDGNEKNVDSDKENQSETSEKEKNSESFEEKQTKFQPKTSFRSLTQSEINKLKQVMTSSDKSAMAKIVMNSLTKEQITEGMKLAADGISAADIEYGKKMVSEALTLEKKQQLLSYINKYIDKLN